MGKTSFLSLLIIISLPSWANCPNKINPARVMLFIDANFGDMEIAAAQKAACNRGERLEVVPKTWKQYSAFQKAVETSTNAMNACMTKFPNASASFYSPNPTSTECAAEFKSFKETNAKMREFTGKQKPVAEQVKERMDELSKEKVKLTNLTLSGHDGGGQFGGQKGSISRSDVSAIMGKYPEMNDVQSLLLLGCYTGVQNEVSAWKGIFPKVKIIGGYDGSAPASNRVQGHKYITNILNKEKVLLSLKNKTTVDQDVKRMINNLGDLHSAVYIDLACKEEDDEFYYASKSDRKFNKLNLSDCEKAIIEMEQLKPYYNQLYSGEIEPPTVTSSGDARNLYDRVRTHEHCITPSGMFGGYANEMNSNGAFNLLFWHGVKENFANFYDKDMQEAEDILKDLNAEEMVKEILGQIEKIEENKKKNAELIKALEESPEAVTAKLEAEIQEDLKKSQEAQKDPAYLAIMNRINSPNNQITMEDMAILNKVSALNSAVYFKQNDLSTLKHSPAQYIALKKATMGYMDEDISQQRRQMSQVQSNPDMFKKIWIPTKANMEKKTRKEVMDNLHAIHGVLSMGALPAKKFGALSFVNSVTSTHLQYFRNPFSWHEFTGNTEAPPHAIRLANYTNGSPYGMMSPSGYGGGFGGGMGMGGMMGPYGGTATGAQGGTNGGGGQMNEQQDRPVH